MDIVRQTVETYDTIAPEYCAKTRDLAVVACEEEYIEKLIAYIAAPIPRILDVGCGDGRHCAIIDKQGGKAVGIDLSDGMLEQARRNYPAGEYRKMDMRRLLFDDDSFDGGWSSGSIYHVGKESVAGVIEEFARVLRPGGVIAVNFKLGEGEGMEENPKSYGGSPRYFAYYTEPEMRDRFRAAGFVVLDSHRFPEEIFGDTIQQMWFRLEGKP